MCGCACATVSFAGCNLICRVHLNTRHTRPHSAVPLLLAHLSHRLLFTLNDTAARISTWAYEYHSHALFWFPLMQHGETLTGNPECVVTITSVLL